MNSMMGLLSCAVGFGVVALLSWLLGYVVRVWVERGRILDIPNARSSHTRPTPRGGGLAIVLICIVGLAVYCRFHPTDDGHSIAGYYIGATLIAVVSWIDDMRSLPSLIRLTTHTLAAAFLLVLFGGWSSTVTLPLVGNLSLAWLGVPIALLWIVGLTNAYNFMDGIDGIAGAQAVVTGFGWLILGNLAGQPALSLLGLLVAASSLGFLLHNWSPARIFMGDVGSAFLGYTFASLAVLATQADPRLGVAGVLLVWPFVFDAAATFLRRLRRGENVFAAHRSHLYQRLVVAGWSHGAVTILYTGLALLGLALAILFATQPVLGDWLATVLLPLAAIALWLFVGRIESKYSAGVPAGPPGKPHPCEDHPRSQTAKP